MSKIRNQTWIPNCYSTAASESTTSYNVHSYSYSTTSFLHTVTYKFLRL